MPPGLPAARHRIYNPSVSRASALLRLQQTDLAIDQTRSKLSTVEAEMAEHGTVERARNEAAEADRRLRQASQALRAAEDAAASQREKLGQVESRLFGGAVHNPKELTELQAEADSLRRFQGSLDDRVLEGMQEAEDAEAAQQTARTRLELAEAEASGRETDLRRERESLMVLLEQHNEEREAAVVGISSEDLALYQSLRKGPGSLAVAELVEDTCSACGVTMSASARQGIRGGPGLTRCPQCGRILYAS
jgi:predicted  nucleic acid-binding Zn-ribbon protein